MEDETDNVQSKTLNTNTLNKNILLTRNEWPVPLKSFFITRFAGLVMIMMILMPMMTVVMVMMITMTMTMMIKMLLMI